MTPERLSECLDKIRWRPDILASALECDISLVNAWFRGEADMPFKAIVWINTLAAFHEAIDGERPKSLRGKKFGRGRQPRRAAFMPKA
ncbi:hypothetical protein AAAK29_29775 [Mesorhizobium sp. CCNWLW179-1]|uniref:hypothetical protein n=1 Tax=unclassified Mesorhizobium TaxID=325217 RepID=UPI003014F81D